MTINDPIGDMLTRIRNGLKAKKTDVSVPFSKMRESILKVLKGEGYILDYKTQEIRTGVKELIVMLKYYAEAGVIQKVMRISKPGRRVYKKVGELPEFYNGLGISIISTSKGVMSDYQARAANLGGELLCQVF